jgi:hypothetical protein
MGFSTFIDAKVRKSSGYLMWYPVAIAEFSDCPTAKHRKYVIDCYLPSALNSPLPRFLTIRRLRKFTLTVSASIDAPIIPHSKCGLGNLILDASKLKELLEDSKAFSLELSKAGPEPYSHGSSSKGVRKRLFQQPVLRHEEIMSLFKEFLKTLCLDSGIPPTGWELAYMLLEIRVNELAVVAHIGHKSERARILETYFFMDKILKDILRHYHTR